MRYFAVILGYGFWFIGFVREKYDEGTVSVR